KGTLKENITVRMPDASDEEILRVSQMSGAQRFVDVHPMGFDMPVGERGESLSGGQKQAISIARAFIHTAPIILLDEPTNSMDSTSEAGFIKALKEYKEGRTTIIISHKPSILQITDRLILIEQGKILLDGTYSDVMKRLTDKRIDKRRGVRQ
ncbi:MAG: ATP-binding cassette domain-containing protein, partial [Sulfurimonas sp.]